MGLGDDLMAVGRALDVSALNGNRPVVIMRAEKSRYWSPMFHGVPWLVPYDRPIGDAVPLYDCPGRRPYIDYRRSNARRQVLVQGHRAARGALFFSEEEQKSAERWIRKEGLEGKRFVAVEPCIKGTFSGENKSWIWDRWEELCSKLSERCPVVQISPPNATPLRNAAHLVRLEVRPALCVLGYAARLVTTDGLLHHAAAALGVPAVVIWGGRTEPSILGYPDQQNLYVEHPASPCGSMQAECMHCRECMDAISVMDVMEAIERLP